MRIKHLLTGEINEEDNSVLSTGGNRSFSHEFKEKILRPTALKR